MSIMAKVTHESSPSKNWKKYWRYTSSPRNYYPKSSGNVSSITGQNLTPNENPQVKRIKTDYHGSYSEICRNFPSLPEWRCIGPRYKIYRHQRAQYEARQQKRSINEVFDSNKTLSEKNTWSLTQFGEQPQAKQGMRVEETNPSLLTQCRAQPPAETKPNVEETNPSILAQCRAQPSAEKKPRVEEINPSILAQCGAQPPAEKKPRIEETNPSILAQCGAQPPAEKKPRVGETNRSTLGQCGTQPPAEKKPRVEETNPSILAQCGSQPPAEKKPRLEETNPSILPQCRAQHPAENKPRVEETNPSIVAQCGAQHPAEKKPSVEETKSSIFSQCEVHAQIQEVSVVQENNTLLIQRVSYSAIEVNQKVNTDSAENQVSRKRPVSRSPSTFLPSHEPQSPHQVKPKTMKLEERSCEGKAEPLNSFDAKSEGSTQEAERKEPKRPSLNDINLPVITKENSLRMFSDAEGKPDIVGEGAFGFVRRGKIRIEGQKHECVVKIFIGNRSTRQMILDEGKILHYLGNTGAVPKFFGLSESKDPKKLPSLVQECFADGQDFCDLIDEDSTSKKDWIEICLNAAEGLSKIHTKGVLINDITEDNILVDDNNNVRFIDMGLATLDKGMTYTPGPELERCVQISPECKSGEETTFKSDIFSFGDVLRCIGEEENIGDLTKLSKSLTCRDPSQRIDLFETIKRLKQLQANIKSC